MAQTEAQKKAQKLYRKKIKSINIAFNESDMDIYEWMQGKENKQGFIKELLRREMEKSN